VEGDTAARIREITGGRRALSVEALGYLRRSNASIECLRHRCGRHVQLGMPVAIRRRPAYGCDMNAVYMGNLRYLRHAGCQAGVSVAAGT